jgi:hypothetical protein
MAVKIESHDYDIEEVLNRGYFQIPRFQRPYSWERSEVDDFWNDVVVDAESDYFIGSVVVYGKGPLCIVDGQQRLTTITMILCALRDALEINDHGNYADGIHRLIERPDINNRNEYVLQTVTSHPYLQEHIQKRGPADTSATPPGDEERLLQEAYEYIVTNVTSTVQDTLSSSLPPKKKKKKVLAELLRIRDRVLRLKVIVIALEREEDAYTIFETMNTRGKDLTVSDLVRTLVTRLLPQGNANVDIPKDDFNAIIEKFDASDADISVNRFLHHQWLSSRPFTTEKKLYKEVKRRIRTQSVARAYLNELKSDSELYRYIHEPDVRKWRIEILPVRGALFALSVFQVRMQMPFVLSVLRDFEAGALPLRDAIRALVAVENFHFAFTAVTSQRSSGGISQMYALHARGLKDAATAPCKRRVISELIKKLRAKRPAQDEFRAGFRTILYSEKFTKRKALVQYVLHKMTEHYARAYAIDTKGMTIEHLACQSGTSAAGLTDEKIAQVGNLLLVKPDLNVALGTKDVASKLRALRDAGAWLDDCLDAATSWDAAMIDKRTDRLADLAYEEVWAL